jgi:kanamycin kinase
MEMKNSNIDVETFPTEIQTYLKDSEINVIKQKVRSSVYQIIKSDSNIFLKVTPKGHMQSEAWMTEYLYNYGVCPKLLTYTTDDSRDYLITEQIVGSDGLTEQYTTQPILLIEVFAASLLSLQSINCVGCPVINDLESMVLRAEGNYQLGRAEQSLLQYMGYTNIDTAYKDLIALYRNTCDDRVIIHGDYCLPNIILLNFKNNGFVDVGYGGMGDRHYDIFWGIWSLQYNYKTDEYAKLFLQAYGRDKVDQDRLHQCGLFVLF